MSAFAGTLMNSSADLVTRVCQGDADAFRLIFERYSRPVIVSSTTWLTTAGWPKS
jgi:hypothetical protein